MSWYPFPSGIGGASIERSPEYRKAAPPAQAHTDACTSPVKPLCTNLRGNSGRKRERPQSSPKTWLGDPLYNPATTATPRIFQQSFQTALKKFVPTRPKLAANPVGSTDLLQQGKPRTRDGRPYSMRTVEEFRNLLLAFLIPLCLNKAAPCQVVRQITPPRRCSA